MTEGTPREERKIREQSKADPEAGETIMTDIGTPQEHASEVVAPPERASSGDPDPPPSREGTKRVLIFLNEVAGGRKLLTASRELAEGGADYFAVVAPQNQPIVGQIVDTEQLREAAQSRVDVTMAVLDEFGIETEGAVMDQDPALALDDAVRATKPDYVLLSALYETRFGLTRKDLVEWAKDNLDARVEHIPVRVDDDAVRWDLTHTLVVATKTVHSKDLLDRLKQRAKERPHRYTFICPRSGDVPREEVCANLAATLAEMYRDDVDATGQPMSPDPFHAIQNAIEHYRLDEILISTLAGAKSVWLEEGLIDRVKEITEKPVEHVESSPGRARRQAKAAATPVGGTA
ncbi:MAG: hypothetical protein ACRDKH_04480 [Solirubrobacterales bacterium]